MFYFFIKLIIIYSSPNENYPFSFKIEPNENIVLLESY